MKKNVTSYLEVWSPPTITCDINYQTSKIPDFLAELTVSKRSGVGSFTVMFISIASKILRYQEATKKQVTWKIGAHKRFS